jgi:hypothetical protein
MFFLGTISAISNTDEKQFDGAATPDIVLVDCKYRDVIWIDVKHPSTWDEEVYNQLGEAWRASEGIGYYYEKEIKDEDLQQLKDSIPLIPRVSKNALEIEALRKKLDSLERSDQADD